MYSHRQVFKRLASGQTGRSIAGRCISPAVVSQWRLARNQEQANKKLDEIVLLDKLTTASQTKLMGSLGMQCVSRPFGAWGK